MKSNHIIWLVSIFCISLCIASLLPAFGLGATATVNDEADKDAYINEGYPTFNFGSYTYGYAGNFLSSECETYMSIPFTHQPEEYIQAQLALSIANTEVTTKLTFCLIENTWNENTLTWNDRLTHGAVFNQTDIPAITSNYWFYINITDLILDTDTRFTFCVNSTDDTNTKAITIQTRESGSRPHIVWTYTTADSTPDVPGYDVVLIGIISVCVIGLIGKKIKLHN